jgi:hypothetical protein
MMGTTVLLFLILEPKKKKLLQYMEKRLCYDIKGDILERRAFEYYMVKVWLKVWHNFSLDFDFCEHFLYGKLNG